MIYFSTSLRNENYAVGDTFGLEKIGGLRELEDLRGPFIMPARNYLTSFKSDGPLIKGSRDSVTADNFFTVLNFSPQVFLWKVRFVSRQNEQEINHDKLIWLT
jgi:hypothetical protein